MLCSKPDVDEHVLGILKLSKNVYDNSIQYKTISKLYYDIKEFGVAKCYINRFLEAKSNSECGLVLKANIHKELKEYDDALKCYDYLYRISQNCEYLFNVCDCLMKMNIDNAKAKSWIELLENEMPDCDKLHELKLHLYLDADKLFSELLKLEIKLKTNGNTRVRRQYLQYLDKAPTSNEILTKCLNVITKYEILHDLVAVECCVRIFQKHQFSTFHLFKPLHCVLLVSAISNSSSTSSSHPWREYLSQLRDLLSVVFSDNGHDLYWGIKELFLYQLVSCAHSVVIGDEIMTEELSRCLYSGYVFLESRDRRRYKVDHTLPEVVCTWMDHQLSCQRSVVHHMVHSASDRVKTSTVQMCSMIAMITRILWPLSHGNNCDLERMFETFRDHDVIMEYSELVGIDMRCYSPVMGDLHLIMWQLMCHVGVFQGHQHRRLVVSRSCHSFISELIQTLFPHREFSGTYSEVISKVDIVTFLLGAAITYRKSITNSRNLLPIPTECCYKLNVGVVKWWNSACECLGNGDSSPDSDVLMTGLRILQVGDGDLGETVMLELGLCLYEFAEYCYYEEHYVRDRAVSFLYNASLLYREKSAPSTIPLRVLYSNPSPPIQVYEIPFFDNSPVPPEITDKWRYESLLCRIDAMIKSGETVEGVDDLIDCAEKIGSPDSNLLLQISRMYLISATNTHHDQRSLRQGRCTTLALRFANECRLKLDDCDHIERNRLTGLLKGQLAAIDRAEDLEYTQCHGSLDNVQTVDLEQYHSSKDTLCKRVNYCVKKCDIVSNSVARNRDDINLMKSNTKSQDDVVRSISEKCENLGREFNKSIIVDDNLERLRWEQRLLRHQIHGLQSATENLTYNTTRLEDNIRSLSGVLSPRSSLDDMMRLELSGTHNLAQVHLRGFDEIEVGILGEYIKSQFTHKCQSPTVPVTNCRSYRSDSAAEVKETSTIRLSSGNSFNLNESDVEGVIGNEPIVSKQRGATSGMMVQEHFYHYVYLSENNEDSSETALNNGRALEMNQSISSTSLPGINGEVFKEIETTKIGFCEMNSGSLSTDNSDSDVVVVMEPFVTAAQKQRATALMLPEHFYYYENMSEKNINGGSSEESIDETEPMDIQESGTDVKSIVLADLEFDCGWNVVYSAPCKLFGSRRNQWTERGSGYIHVFSRSEPRRIGGHFIMKLIPGNIVCLDKTISKKWPQFRVMSISVITICWQDNCVYESSDIVPCYETLALRFRSEMDLKRFTSHVAALQYLMDE